MARAQGAQAAPGGPQSGPEILSGDALLLSRSTMKKQFRVQGFGFRGLGSGCGV